jgi:hypothetical protein
MATRVTSRVSVPRPAKKAVKVSARKAEKDLLASVMVSVSASLEKMTEKEREQAVKSAERAVAHLQFAR